MEAGTNFDAVDPEIAHSFATQSLPLYSPF
jgi:hypothetical protein